MSDYLVRTHANENIIYENLSLFYNLACDIEKGLSDYFDSIDISIDYTKIAKVTLMDKFTLIQKFYEKIGVEFDFDKFISDGTIELMYYDCFNENDDLEHVKFHHMCWGENTYENSKKIINIPNTGLITDVFVAVHEISHLRDQPDDRRNQTSDLLTESLASAEELICMDYLSKIGYEEEMELWKKILFETFYNIARDTKPVYKMFLLHKELGNISKENYGYYFKNETQYEKIIEYMSRFVKKQSFDLYYNSWYVMGALLSTFMYTQYKKDNNYSQIILELHDKINEANVLECLQSIGLQDLGEEDRIKLSASLEEVKMELSEIETKKSSNISK